VFKGFDGVREIDRIAIDRCFDKGFIKNLSGWSLKGQAHLIFNIARLFADEHQTG
jgi:hypothetical protein